MAYDATIKAGTFRNLMAALARVSDEAVLRIHDKEGVFSTVIDQSHIWIGDARLLRQDFERWQSFSSKYNVDGILEVAVNVRAIKDYLDDLYVKQRRGDAEIKIEWVDRPQTDKEGKYKYTEGSYLVIEGPSDGGVLQRRFRLIDNRNFTPPKIPAFVFKYEITLERSVYERFIKRARGDLLAFMMFPFGYGKFSTNPGMLMASMVDDNEYDAWTVINAADAKDQTIMREVTTPVFALFPKDYFSIMIKDRISLYGLHDDITLALCGEQKPLQIQVSISQNGWARYLLAPRILTEGDEIRSAFLGDTKRLVDGYYGVNNLFLTDKANVMPLVKVLEDTNYINVNTANTLTMSAVSRMKDRLFRTSLSRMSIIDRVGMRKATVNRAFAYKDLSDAFAAITGKTVEIGTDAEGGVIYLTDEERPRIVSVVKPIEGGSFNIEATFKGFQSEPKLYGAIVSDMNALKKALKVETERLTPDKLTLLAVPRNKSLAFVPYDVDPDVMQSVLVLKEYEGLDRFTSDTRDSVFSAYEYWQIENVLKVLPQKKATVEMTVGKSYMLYVRGDIDSNAILEVLMTPTRVMYNVEANTKYRDLVMQSFDVHTDELKGATERYEAVVPPAVERDGAPEPAPTPVPAPPVAAEPEPAVEEVEPRIPMPTLAAGASPLDTRHYWLLKGAWDALTGREQTPVPAEFKTWYETGRSQKEHYKRELMEAKPPAPPDGRTYEQKKYDEEFVKPLTEAVDRLEWHTIEEYSKMVRYRMDDPIGTTRDWILRNELETAWDKTGQTYFARPTATLPAWLSKIKDESVLLFLPDKRGVVIDNKTPLEGVVLRTYIDAKKYDWLTGWKGPIKNVDDLRREIAIESAKTRRPLHFVSFSGGKDSSAMLVRMLELGMPVDYIIFADTGLEFEEIYDHIKEMDDWLSRNYSKRVTVVKIRNTFYDWFFGGVTRGELQGTRRGHPLMLSPCYWTREAKVKIMDSFMQGHERYIGFAINETKRLKPKPHFHYPLADWNMTEQQALQYLIQKGRAKPIHSRFNRTGCYSCPKQPKASLAIIQRVHPDKWEKCKQMEQESPGGFRPDIKLADIEKGVPPVELDVQLECSGELDRCDLKGEAQVKARVEAQVVVERCGEPPAKYGDMKLVPCNRPKGHTGMHNFVSYDDMKEMGYGVDDLIREEAGAPVPAPAPVVVVSKQYPPGGFDASKLGRCVTHPYPLREIQTDSVDKFLRAKKGIIALATGVGKTSVAWEALNQLGCPPMLFVAPTRALVKQMQGDLERRGIPRRDIGGYYTDEKNIRKYTFTAYPSLVADPTMMDKFDLVVFDEAHHLKGDTTWAALGDRIAAKTWVLGLTATPPLLEEGDVAFKVIEQLPVLEWLAVSEAQRRGLVSRSVLHVVGVDLDPGEALEYNEANKLVLTATQALGTSDPRRIKMMGGAMKGYVGMYFKGINARKEIASRASNKREKIIDILSRHPDERKAMLFSSRVATLDLVKDWLTQAGYRMETVVGPTKAPDRIRILETWGEDFEVLGSVNVLKEGIDVPDVKLGIFVGSGSSERELTQKVGRLIRKVPGEKAANLYVVYAVGTVDEKLKSALEELVSTEGVEVVSEGAKAITLPPTKPLTPTEPMIRFREIKPKEEPAVADIKHIAPKEPKEPSPAAAPSAGKAPDIDTIANRLVGVHPEVKTTVDVSVSAINGDVEVVARPRKEHHDKFKSPRTMIITGTKDKLDEIYADFSKWWEANYLPLLEERKRIKPAMGPGKTRLESLFNSAVQEGIGIAGVTGLSDIRNDFDVEGRSSDGFFYITLKVQPNKADKYFKPEIVVTVGSHDDPTKVMYDMMYPLKVAVQDTVKTGYLWDEAALSRRAGSFTADEAARIMKARCEAGAPVACFMFYGRIAQWIKGALSTWDDSGLTPYTSGLDYVEEKELADALMERHSTKRENPVTDREIQSWIEEWKQLLQERYNTVIPHSVDAVSREAIKESQRIGIEVGDALMGGQRRIGVKKAEPALTIPEIPKVAAPAPAPSGIKRVTLVKAGYKDRTADLRVMPPDVPGGTKYEYDQDGIKHIITRVNGDFILLNTRTYAVSKHEGLETVLEAILPPPVKVSVPAPVEKPEAPTRTREVPPLPSDMNDIVQGAVGAGKAKDDIVRELVMDRELQREYGPYSAEQIEKAVEDANLMRLSVRALTFSTAAPPTTDEIQAIGKVTYLAGKPREAPPELGNPAAWYRGWDKGKAESQVEVDVRERMKQRIEGATIAPIAPQKPVRAFKDGFELGQELVVERELKYGGLTMNPGDAVKVAQVLSPSLATVIHMPSQTSFMLSLATAVNHLGIKA